jgi:branched-chain amino acid transport system substrate-binding protein
MMTSLRWTLAAVLFFISSTSYAQIFIGQTAGVTGTVAATVKESLDGAKLYFDFINARGGVVDNVNRLGGIKGEMIELITLDDKFDVKQTVANAEFLITNKNVVALFLTRGTPNNEALFPVLEKYNVPLVGPATGAAVMHKPVNRFVFNVRSSYQREAERSVIYLDTVGFSRIAVVHPDDSFGRDALEGAENGFRLKKIKPVIVLAVDRIKPNYAQVIDALKRSNAQAVLWVGSGTAVSDGVIALRRTGSGAQVVTLSNNASGGFVKALGEFSRGVIVSQVFPNEKSMSFSLVKDAVALAKAKGINEISPAMLEGYAAAKVLVEALRRASPNPTRAKVLTALNSMSAFDLGGLTIGYSPSDHTGLEFSDLSIISETGKFQR